MSEITSFVCPDSWDITTLGQICKETGGSIQTGPFGSQLHASDYVEDGIPSVMPKNISIEKILDDDIARVSVDDVKRLSKHKLQIGDIVYSRRGDVEKCVLVSEKEEGWLCGTGCIKVRVGPVGDISAKYIHAYLSHPEVRRWISQHAVGATMPNLNTSILGSVPVYLPPREIQNFIADSWFGFNQKLLVNSSINNTLEKIAQAIFKSWFVDFEPTKAKIAAREALLAENAVATPEHIATAEQQAAIQVIAGAGDIISTEQLQTIAELFPNQMVDSDLGEIPDGWEISEIGNEVKVCGGATPSTKNAEYWDDGNIAWTTPKDLSGNTSKILIDTDRKITELGLKKISSGLLPVDTVLLSSRAPVGYLALAKIHLAVNQGYIAMVCDKNITPEFVINWCDSVMDEIKQRASGTTFSEISKKNFKLIKITLPPKTLCDRYSRITKPLYNLIASNEIESKMLTSLRDTLLPKLLAGEISVQQEELES